MAGNATILDALMAHLAAFTYSPALPISWPEQAETFETPADGKYLVVLSFANAPRWQGLAAGKIDQGMLQVTVVWPKNQGLIAPASVADALIAHFPRGQRFGPVKVQGEPVVATPIPETDKVSIPVTIRWTA